jgi:hypothetical protein
VGRDVGALTKDLLWQRPARPHNPWQITGATALFVFLRPLRAATTESRQSGPDLSEYVVENRSMPLPSEAQSKIEVRASWTLWDSENLIGLSIPDIAALFSRGLRSTSHLDGATSAHAGLSQHVFCMTAGIARTRLTPADHRIAERGGYRRDRRNGAFRLEPRVARVVSGGAQAQKEHLRGTRYLHL